MAMTIQEIEAEMEEIQMLMKIWNQFYRILTITFFDENANLKELDRDFQKIKQVVAEHHAHFMKVIKKDYHIGQSILTTVKRTISLEGFMNLSDLEIRKTMIEWHDANILLNETIGSLECERDKINRGRVQKAPKKKTGDSAREFFSGGTFKLLINVAIFAAVLGALFFFLEDIRALSFYQDYLGGTLDPLLESVGLITPDPAG